MVGGWAGFLCKSAILQESLERCLAPAHKRQLPAKPDGDECHHQQHRPDPELERTAAGRLRLDHSTCTLFQFSIPILRYFSLYFSHSRLWRSVSCTARPWI